MDIKNEIVEVESWFKKELKGNWGRIIIAILLLVVSLTAYYDFREEFKVWMKNPNNTIIQNTPAPLNMNANGNLISSPPPVYVNINPVVSEKSTAVLTPVTTNATPSANIIDNKPVFFLNYNGTKYNYVPFTTDQANFDPKSWQFSYTRNTIMDINIEVPQPRYSIGIGKSLTGGYAITGDYRLGKSPFQVWGYASNNDTAIGLKFTQYSTSSKGGDKK